MGKYDELLAGVKIDYSNAIKWIRRFADSSKIKIPQLCEALREEQDKDGIKLSNEDIRDRIMKDCLEFWQKSTIYDAFPDWLVRDYEKPEVSEVSEETILENMNESDMSISNMLVTIPEDEEKKFKSERIQKATLEIKRNFRMLLQEVNDKDEVQKLYNDYVYANHALGNVKEAIENLGRKYKAVLTDPIQLKHKSLRKPISVYDLNFTSTEDTKAMIEEITDYVTLAMKQLDDFLNGLHRYPILTTEEYNLMRKSAKSFLIEVFNYVNNKSSQSIYDQLETDLMSEETTDPQAARNTKTLTLVCKTCIKKFDPEHNDDPPVMQIDKSSPNNFRCPVCLGMEMCERSLTKDIIAQRKDFLKKVSEHFKEAPPMQFLQVYSKAVKERLTSTRKTLMSKMLKNSSFGSSIEEFH
jgi:hypothetical protein